MNNKFQGRRVECGVYDDVMDMKIPCLIINCPEEYPTPLNKTIIVSGKYIDPNNPEKSFTFSEATLIRRVKEEQYVSKANC